MEPASDSPEPKDRANTDSIPRTILALIVGMFFHGLISTQARPFNVYWYFTRAFPRLTLILLAITPPSDLEVGVFRTSWYILFAIAAAFVVLDIVANATVLYVVKVQARWKLDVAIKVTDRDTGKDLSLSRKYYELWRMHYSIAMSLTLLVATLYTVATGDYTGVWIWLACYGVFACNCLVTNYRVDRGFFGSVANEAEELINFIAIQSSRGNPPGESRVSWPVRETARFEVNTAAGTVSGNGG